ncbi:emopamil-binding protein, partial [Rhodococcus oxybenzonivorans]|nr:emopamil-binding protein [Rhodococcus oxybenzonivorans]
MTVTFKEHDLSLPVTGRRRRILLWGGLFANLNLLAWLGIGFGILPVQPTSDLIALFVILPTLFLPFVALLDNPGENRSRL